MIEINECLNEVFGDFVYMVIFVLDWCLVLGKLCNGCNSWCNK